MESFDAITIGAGAGGLSAAAGLARAGKKCVVVEQDCQEGTDIKGRKRKIDLKCSL